MSVISLASPTRATQPIVDGRPRHLENGPMGTRASARISVALVADSADDAFRLLGELSGASAELLDGDEQSPGLYREEFLDESLAGHYRGEIRVSFRAKGAVQARQVLAEACHTIDQANPGCTPLATLD